MAETVAELLRGIVTSGPAAAVMVAADQSQGATLEELLAVRPAPAGSPLARGPVRG